MIFLCRELFWFCLVQASTTQFCCFPTVLMAHIDDASDRPVPPSPVQHSSSNFGSPNGSAPDLDGTGIRPSTMEEKMNEIYLQLPFFLQNASRIENSVQTLSQTVASSTARSTSVERIVSNLAARDAALETSAASVSSGSGSARSWNLLGQSDGSTAAGSRGPGSFDDNRNTKR